MERETGRSDRKNKKLTRRTVPESLSSGGLGCSGHGNFSGSDGLRLGIFSSENEASKEIAGA